jgi:membrane protease YdiL (CAAX protease family)
LNLDAPPREETAPPTGPARPAERLRRLTLGQALFAVLAAFLLAQLMGKAASDIASATLGKPLPPPAADGGERSSGAGDVNKGERSSGAGDVNKGAPAPVTPHAPAPRLSPEVVVPAMIASELALVLVALLAPLLRSLPLREALGLTSHHAPGVFLAAAGGTVMLGPLGDLLMTAFSTHFPELTLGVVPTLHELGMQLPLLLLWPTFALLPGIAEELLFRGVLQRSVRRASAAVLVSGGLFAAFHVDPVHVAGVLPLGLFLAWVAQRTSTWVSIFAHVMNNTLAVIAMRSPEFDVGYGTAHAMPPSWVAASLALFVVAALWIARQTRA